MITVISTIQNTGENNGEKEGVREEEWDGRKRGGVMRERERG